LGTKRTSRLFDLASSAPASLVDLPSGRGEPLAEATFEPAAFAPPPPPPRRALSSCSCMRSGPEKKLEEKRSARPSGGRSIGSLPQI
jgi:hypothetical protein